jgi:hypothetical protein
MTQNSDFFQPTIQSQSGCGLLLMMYCQACLPWMEASDQEKFKKLNLRANIQKLIPPQRLGQDAIIA